MKVGKKSAAKVLVAFLTFSVLPASASVVEERVRESLITCTDLESGLQIALKDMRSQCPLFHAPAIWKLQRVDSAQDTSFAYSRIRVCSSQNPTFNYLRIKKLCPRHQVTTDYFRTVFSVATPEVVSARAVSSTSAVLQMEPLSLAHTPIAYYLVTDLKSGNVSRIAPSSNGDITLTTLSPQSNYTFTIEAVTVDGKSAISNPTPPVWTHAPPAPVIIAPSLLRPAFTLAVESETVARYGVMSDYSITSTGGAIASFSISPSLPMGLSINAETGLISGRPQSITGATVYTITAANAAGSYSREFTLTTRDNVIGDRGQGGGTIFYVANTPFNCGPDLTLGLGCHFLETAPMSSTGTLSEEEWWDSTTYSWGGISLLSVGGLSTAIGAGYSNTLLMVSQDARPLRPHTITRAFRGSENLDDWYLPSYDELNVLCQWARGVPQDPNVLCSGGLSASQGFRNDGYWSSSSTRISETYMQDFRTGTFYSRNRILPAFVRPIRAFA